MTSPNTLRRSSTAEGRRRLHQARIDAAEPGSRRRRWLILAWLQAEVAAGGDLGAVLDLAQSMNRRAS